MLEVLLLEILLETEKEKLLKQERMEALEE